jgi:hypothetical protein
MGDKDGAIRELCLRRRRSPIKWIYLVYQAPRKGPGQALVEQSRGGSSALPAQERGYIQGRLEFDIAEVFV